jgi:hypothetical protein
MEYSTEADVDWLFYNHRMKHSYDVEQMRELVSDAHVELAITAKDLRILDESLCNQNMESLDVMEQKAQLRGHTLIQSLHYVRELK